MNTNCSNIFQGFTLPESGETFETLLHHDRVKIKRIISSDKIDQQVMIQEEDEWFIMLEGEATMMIENEKKVLNNGDHCFIKARTPHQILSVKKGTIWLAVHF